MRRSVTQRKRYHGTQQESFFSENHSPRLVNLDQHESVRSHINRQLSGEVRRLERRIETLRLTGPATIMISPMSG